MNNKINNINTMLKNPQQRNVYLSVIGVAVVTLIVGIWFASSGASHNQTSLPAAAQVAEIPNVEVIPGAVDSPQYNIDVQRQNELLAQQAIEQNRTFIPTPISPNMTGQSPIDDLIRQQEERRLAELRQQEQLLFEQQNQANQQPLIAAPQQPQPTNETVNKMEYGHNDYMLISALLGVWSPRGTTPEFDFSRQQVAGTISVGGGPPNAGEQAAIVQQEQTNEKATNTAITIGTAGTIYNAILETGINSDEPSPVLARIITGPLTGTRLIGQMTRSGERVLVQFSTASVPNLNNSIRINAVAIDPDTSRTTLASHVNRHTFFRYGILLAATFLGGYAEAIARQNTVTTVTPDGNVTQTTGQLSSRDITRQAVGSVGQTLAQQVEQQAQGLEPTITVNSGVALGILLMEDLVLN